MIDGPVYPENLAKVYERSPVLRNKKHPQHKESVGSIHGVFGPQMVLLGQTKANPNEYGFAVVFLQICRDVDCGQEQLLEKYSRRAWASIQVPEHC
jgi:hypothetical protein